MHTVLVHWRLLNLNALVTHNKERRENNLTFLAQHSCTGPALEILGQLSTTQIFLYLVAFCPATFQEDAKVPPILSSLSRACTCSLGISAYFLSQIFFLILFVNPASWICSTRFLSSCCSCQSQEQKLSDFRIIIVIHYYTSDLWNIYSL